MLILMVRHSLGAASKVWGLKLTHFMYSSLGAGSEIWTSLWSLTLNLYRLTLSFWLSVELFLTRSSVETGLPGVVVRFMGRGEVVRLKPGVWAEVPPSSKYPVASNHSW